MSLLLEDSTLGRTAAPPPPSRPLTGGQRRRLVPGMEALALDRPTVHRSAGSSQTLRSPAPTVAQCSTGAAEREASCSPCDHVQYAWAESNTHTRVPLAVPSSSLARRLPPLPTDPEASNVAPSHRSAASHSSARTAEKRLNSTLNNITGSTTALSSSTSLWHSQGTSPEVVRVRLPVDASGKGPLNPFQSKYDTPQPVAAGASSPPSATRRVHNVTSSEEIRRRESSPIMSSSHAVSVSHSGEQPPTEEGPNAVRTCSPHGAALALKAGRVSDDASSLLPVVPPTACNSTSNESAALGARTECPASELKVLHSDDTEREKSGGALRSAQHSRTSPGAPLPFGDTAVKSRSSSVIYPDPVRPGLRLSLYAQMDHRPNSDFEPGHEALSTLFLKREG